MQYLTNPQGEPLGVFLTMEEWNSFRRHEISPTSYDEWERKAVLKALHSLSEGNIVPDDDVRARFSRLGATLG